MLIHKPLQGSDFCFQDAINSYTENWSPAAGAASQALTPSSGIPSWRDAAFSEQLLCRPREAGTGMSQSRGFERWGGLTSLTSQACFQMNLL